MNPLSTEGIAVRIFLSWDYCHVNRQAAAFIRSHIAYVGSVQGSHTNGGSAITK
ncbi:hypothetical protein PSTT_08654 [Puccinia striiformis]|uniref:Uncharacterized protein n=1 Tax=Puccinia striiformis TaxID=27350 RepID=A0A2S4VBL6_9BASI|nr:hypothetical protein PSTT_08654 [Puccinia striiformis]